MHVAAAAAWGVAQSISNAAEGITWGVLLAVCVLRIPKVWRCWMGAVTDPLWIALVAWSAWIAISSWWSPAPPSSARDYLPDRWVLTPLMLWPVMGRPWIVLVAIGAGACLQAGIAIILSWGGRGMARYVAIRSASSFGQLQWQLHCALVISASAIRWLPAAGLVGGVAGLLASGLVIARAATRLPILSGLVGAGIVALRPAPRSVAGRRMRALVLLGLVAAVVGAAFLPVGVRIRKNAHAALAGGAETARVIDSMAGHRVTLALAAIDLGSAHPWAGNGRGAFRALLPEWARARAAAHPDQAKALRVLEEGSLNDAHNAFLQSFVDAGVGASLLLAVVLGGIGWRLWRGSSASGASAAALALFSVILLGAFSQPLGAKAPGAIIAVCLAVSSASRIRP